MKYLLIILALFCAGSVYSQPTTKIDPKDPGYVRSVGNGTTLENAKNDAFRNAITMIVGTAVLSERESRKDNLTKDDLLNYSAGYVDRYQVTDKIENLNNVTVIVDVIVKSSKIHERVLNTGRTEKQIEGDRLSTQYNTYLEQQKSGDAFLGAVVNDYPNRAFEIKQGKHEFVLDSKRRAILIVPFEMRWSYKYLVALNEALGKVQYGDRRSSERINVISKNPKDWMFGRTDTYYFNDGTQPDQLKSTFRSELFIQAKIKDGDGDVLFAECYNPDVTFAGANDRGSYTIFGNEVLDNNVQIPINYKIKAALERADSVELSVTKTCLKVNN